MKILKNALIFIVCLCLVVSCVGCGGQDVYDDFDPVGVYVVETLGENQIETNIDDEKIAKKMWKTFDNLYIDTEQRGRMGSSYIYMCFYNEDESTLAIFTIYENGACCLGEDFENFYTVTNGEDAYMEFYETYTDFVQK